MCMSSAIIDYGRDNFPLKYPWIEPSIPSSPGIWPTKPVTPVPTKSGPTQEEFDQLRQEVRDLADMVRKAIDYDKKNNQPHCEDPEKVKFLAEIAKKANINIDDLINELNKI